MNVEKIDLVEEKLRRLLQSYARLQEENSRLRQENEALLSMQADVKRKVDGLLARLADVE